MSHSFESELISLAIAARSLSGTAGGPDIDAIREGCNRTSAAPGIGWCDFRDSGISLLLMCRTFLAAGPGARPQLEKAIGYLAADILRQKVPHAA
jgi:hypothetical protein